jgi:hypothetical protein
MTELTPELENVRDCSPGLGKFAIFADESPVIMLKFAFSAVCA